MIPLGLEIFLVILFLVLHAFFSLAETSVLNVRKSRLRELLDDEETPEWKLRSAQLVLSFKLQPENFLATVQSGSVFFSFLAATFTAFITYEQVWPLLHLDLGWASNFSLVVAFIVMIIIVTVLDLTIGALIPKSIALRESEPISLGIARVLEALMSVMKPVTHLPVLISNLVLGPFRDRTSFTESRISEEEFRMMLEEGARSGAIDKTENELIENIFEFNDRTAREVMVPRIKMIALDVDMPRKDLIERIISEGFTRLPVYQDTFDNILGVIYSKDVLALIEHPELIILYDIVRPVPFVPETKLLGELLREFQREKLHMAIVVDEFGGTAGLITLEDVLEEIVGDIQDEYDTEQRSVRVGKDRKSITLSANYSIGDANSELEKIFTHFHIPEDEEYESVSGFVNKLFEHIPDLGETRETQGVRIVVTKKGRMNISEVRFEDADHETGPREDVTVNQTA
ncbi:MAG TPA: hemolysin family protein [Candidatus Kapabacteria bacterium]|nr:hemolysin family protein [Candidatus Kapabacteria bacterium]